MQRQSERDVWLEEAMVQWEVPLLRSAYLILRDRLLAEDCVQETFVKAWRAYDRRRKDASEKSWLMRILVNTSKDLLRSKWMRYTNRKVPAEELPEQSVPFEMPDDTLVQAVLSLPDALRTVITLRFYQEMQIGEIAGVLRCSRRTVHYRLEQAQRLLQGSLKEWYDAE